MESAIEVNNLVKNATRQRRQQSRESETTKMRIAPKLMNEKLTASNEDYLVAIYALHDKAGSVRSIDVARQLGVSKASVSNAVSRLKSAGFIDQPFYG